MRLAYIVGFEVFLFTHPPNKHDSSDYSPSHQTRQIGESPILPTNMIMIRTIRTVHISMITTLNQSLKPPWIITLFFYQASLSLMRKTSTFKLIKLQGTNRKYRVQLFLIPVVITRLTRKYGEGRGRCCQVRRVATLAAH